MKKMQQNAHLQTQVLGANCPFQMWMLNPWRIPPHTPLIHAPVFTADQHQLRYLTQIAIYHITN